MANGNVLREEDERRLKDEMRTMAYEPLLPVEKKLIGYSIGLGAILLVIFVWLSQTYFPAPR